MKIWRVALFWSCAGAVATQQFFTERYYQWMLDHGAYRPEEDSIAIPILGNFMHWIFWAPVLAIALWFAFRKLRPPFRLLAWDQKQKVKSWAVTLVCAVLVYLAATGIPEAIEWKNYVDLGYSVWWVAVWVLIRAAILSPREPNQRLENNAGLPPPSDGKATAVEHRLPGVSQP